MWYVWRNGKVRTRFRWENLSERANLEDLGVDGRIILKLIFKKGDGGMEGIDLTQDKENSGLL